MRIFIPFVLIAFTLMGASTSDRMNDDLHWDPVKSLSWDDFRGRPDHLAKGDAASRISLRARPYKKRNQLFYVVTPVFHRNESWCKKPTPELLAHEQLHFDIAELFARKSRMKISTLKRQGVRDVSVYNAAVSEIFEESNRVDAQYDHETVHGASRKKQTEWEYSVRIELMLLNRFSSENWKH